MSTGYINQPYKRSGRSSIRTVETSIFANTDYQNYLWGAKFAKGSLAIGSGMPVVWVEEDNKQINVLQKGTVTALETNTFTLTDGHENRFLEGDNVYVATQRFDQIEFCGKITNIDTVSHKITVTVTPSIEVGYLYVNTDKDNASVDSVSADSEAKVITLTTVGDSYKFKIGDIVHETEAGGSGITNLGAITDIDHAAKKITVTVAPAVTDGGILKISYGLPEILGVSGMYVSDVTDYEFGTTYEADTEATYVVKCEVFNRSLDWYTSDKIVIDRMKETCPNVIVSTNQNNGI
jgi:hypothetical protein